MSIARHANSAARRSALAQLRDLRRDRSGGVAIIFALMAPILFGLAGAAIDFTMYVRDRTELQGLADAAAIASAREMQMAKADETRIKAVAEAYVRARQPTASVQAEVDVPKLSVKVTAQKDFHPFMGKLFWQSEPDVTATATAKLNGSLPLCLLALERRAGAAIHLERSAQMTAPGCMVYSNSEHPSGVQAKDNAILTSALTCSAGGRGRASSAKFTPEPVLDCPRLDDPLASRTAPPSQPCRAHDKKLDTGRAEVLLPGTYCGGLRITNGTDVSLVPGNIYTFKDGPLIVERGGTLRGIDVAIYMKGRGANLTFAANSTISLSAPKEGPLAGILIFDDPTGAGALAIPPFALPIPLLGEILGLLGLNDRPPREHKILSDNARNLLGTIYMPKGRLIIDATKPIADKSAYTVLVVQRIDLHDGPNLYLNSDYGASDVPVPKGVGPFGSKIMLTN
jgi:Flp pilus assembly protein TadG